jgi:DNA-binding FadR family transcriptional regulator
MKSLKPIETSSVHDTLVACIKEYILENALRPGDSLPTEAQLADQLRVSRSGVREALRSLQSLGVITARRGEGHYVNGFNLDPIVQNLNYSMLFDIEDAQELLEVRERLEISFIADAAAAMDEPTLESLRALVRVMCRKADQDRLFLEEDIAFHRTLYQTIRNRFLLKLLDVFWTVYDHLRDRSLLEVQDLRLEARSHEQILQALEARDGEAAKQHLIRHFASIEGRLKPGRPLTNANGPAPAGRGDESKSIRRTTDGDDAAAAGGAV